MAITMEELKRKAKAYDEALESAKEIVNNQNASSVWKDWLRNTFPELRESKGEEIRKNIISYLHNEKKVKRYISDIEFDKWIAWIEKQEEQVEINPSEFDLRLNKLLKQFETLPKEELMDSLSFYLNVIQNDGTYKSDEKQGEQKHKFIIGDIISNNNVIYRVDNIVKNCIGQDCYFLVNIESEKKGIRYVIIRDSEGKTSHMGEITWLCEQVDAKFEKKGEPIDKIEPKFQKGQWIVWQNKCYKVNDNGCGYELIDQNGLSTSLEYGTVDKDAHLWTIADAKEGDVLYCKSDSGIEYIVMNKGINECGNIDSYFRYNSLDDFGFNIPSVLSVKDDNITPATKEQCDLLFKKLKEDGYEWDAEKKKPKKLGQQEVTKISDQEKDFIEIPFGAYDSEFIEDTYFIPEGCYAVIVGDEVVIKKGEKPTTWSEEDECYMSECIGAIATKNGWSFEEKRKTKLWLFSLKQRIGG